MPRRLAPLLLVLLAVVGCDTTTDRVPSRAMLIGIDLEDAPLRQLDGSRWDGEAGGGPELYVRLYDDRDVPSRDACSGNRDLLNPRDNTSLYPLTGETPWYDDVETRDFPLSWVLDGGFDLRGLDDPLVIVVCDYDPTTADDEVALTTVFSLRDQAPATADGFEDAIVLEGAGADRDRVLVRLRVEYR